MKEFFTGVKRRGTYQRQGATRQVTEGKQELSISALRILGKACMQSSHKRTSPFAHLCTLLKCNLMFRTNIESFITMPHLKWSGHAMSVPLSKKKTKNAGDPRQDLKQVYSNTFIPEVRPIISMSIYFDSTTIEFTDESLLTRGNQQDKFLKHFHALLQSRTVPSDLSPIGAPPMSELGSHSLRK